MDRLFAAMRETGMELTATITPPGDEHGTARHSTSGALAFFAGQAG
jgi:hypothetical protein